MGAKVTTRNVILAGLSGAGKTQLLYTLKLNDDPGRFEPTRAMNYERVVVVRDQMKTRFVVNAWDLPGSTELRSLWKIFCDATNVEICVWVIDANDRKRLPESLKILSRFAHEDGVRLAEFIIVLNATDKRDVLGRIKTNELEQALLEMPTLARLVSDNDMKVVELNAKDRDTLPAFKDMLCTERTLKTKEAAMAALGFAPVISE